MPDFIFPEGATPLEPDEASGLLLTHITTRGELDRWEQENIIQALLWLDRTKPADLPYFLRKEIFCSGHPADIHHH